MASRDLHSTIFAEVALKNAAIVGSTTTVGEIIDMGAVPGQEALEFIIQSGTLVDGVYVAKVEDGNDAALADAADVSSEFLLPTDGTALTDATFTLAADSDQVRRLGYVGHKRYVRLSIVSTGITSGGPMSAVAVKGNLLTNPSAANK